MEKAAQYFYPFEMEFCLSAVGLLAGLTKIGEMEFLNIEKQAYVSEDFAIYDYIQCSAYLTELFYKTIACDNSTLNDE